MWLYLAVLEARSNPVWVESAIKHQLYPKFQCHLPTPSSTAPSADGCRWLVACRPIGSRSCGRLRHVVSNTSSGWSGTTDRTSRASPVPPSPYTPAVSRPTSVYWSTAQFGVVIVEFRQDAWTKTFPGRLCGVVYVIFGLSVEVQLDSVHPIYLILIICTPQWRSTCSIKF